MDDSTVLQGDRPDAGERYTRELADFAEQLRELRLERGNPSLRSIVGHARKIGEQRLVHNTLSEVFNGARLPRLELLLPLVRTLLAYDEDGQPCPGPSAGSPDLQVWRDRWRALEAQRVATRWPAAKGQTAAQSEGVVNGSGRNEPARRSSEPGAREDSSVLAAAQREADGIRAVAAARSEELLVGTQADRDQAAADLARARARAVEELANAREEARRERERAAADAARIREQAVADAARAREQAAQSAGETSDRETGMPGSVEEPVAGAAEKADPGATVDKGAGGNFADVMDAFFSSQNRDSRRQRGKDAEIRLDVGLDEIVFGANKDVQVDTAVVCTVCGGDGAAPGTLLRMCDMCEGHGEISQPVRSFLGEVMTKRPCPRCQGFGATVPNPCSECAGDGRVRARRTLTLRIPAGVDNGARLQFAGEGEVGPGGGPPADLYVEIWETAHPVFQRRGNDLHCTLTVPMTIAVLGMKMALETLDGPREIDLAPGAQTGELIRLAGLGVPLADGEGRGELVIHIHVTTPTFLNAEQKQLISQLATQRAEDRPGHQGEFSRPPDTLDRS